MVRPRTARSSLRLDRLRRAAADLDAPRLARLGLRDPHLEDAVVEARGDGLRVDALRERQRPRKRSERALDAVIALVLGLVLSLALAGHGERAVLELDLDVVLVEAGKIGTEDEVVLRLDEVHRRHPAAQGAAAIAPGGSVERRVEQPVHLVLERAELTERLPAHDCHLIPPRGRRLQRWAQYKTLVAETQVS